MEKRIVWIDNLKGFLIYLVVLGHCIQYTNANYDKDFIFNLIYSFHMALFMFISGYVNKKSSNSILLFIKKRFIQLVVPFFVWTMVIIIVNRDYNVVNYLLNPSSSLWFLWVLFFVTLFYLAFNKLAVVQSFVNPDVFIFIEVLLLMFLQYLFKIQVLSFNLICLHLLFYFLGAICSKRVYIFKKNRLIPVVCLFLILGVTFNRTQIPEWFPIQNLMFYTIFVALFGIYAFVLLFKNYCNKGNDILLKLGGGNFGYL